MAEDYSSLVTWYKDVLGLKESFLAENDYDYCILENNNGIRIGFADSSAMGVAPGERANNPIVLQCQVSDVQGFFDYLNSEGSIIIFGPSYDKKDSFWYGAFQDLEGNPIWVVDENCP
jgi:predicted enzyme related to lactoylglutathione lyase